MAKIPFSKLEVKLNTDVNKLYYENSKEKVQYEVRYYLPVLEKIEMISNIINQSIDDNGFYNPLRVQIFTVLETIYAYTNLNFTAKQKEDPFKLYDLLISSGIFKDVIDHIWEDDWKRIQETVINTIDNIYKYKNSALGIMETITSDYENLNLDAQKLQKTIGDPDNISLLKDILAKLG